MLFIDWKVDSLRASKLLIAPVCVGIMGAGVMATTFAPTTYAADNPNAPTPFAVDVKASVAHDTAKISTKAQVKRLDVSKITAVLESQQQRVEAAALEALAAAHAPEPEQPASSSSTVTFSPAPVSSYGNDVVAAAMSRIGTPYVWGGTTPAGFDCSGLVQWSFAQVGVSLPRTSQAQSTSGTPVSLENIQPGDVVGYYSGLSHVAIYIGNGQVVHAPTEGQTVTVADLHHAPITAVARY